MPPQRSPFFTQLDGKVNVTDPGIQLVVVGLQEIEMGGSSVALAAAKDALSYRLQASWIRMLLLCKNRIATSSDRNE